MTRTAIEHAPTELPPLEPLHGVLTIVGHGLRISVERGHLVVEDGAGRMRRRAVFPRINSGIRRLVVLGQSGAFTFEAMRWLHELNISFVHLDGDGAIIASGAPGQLRDAHVRRAQANAISSGAAIAIARELVSSKLTGQQRVFDRLPAARGERDELVRATEALEEADTLDRIRFIEARAAAIYWRGWEALPIQFAGREAKVLPRHWRTFGQRRSHLSPGPRKATTPGNALLNYLYAILEAETRIALLAVGCDPQLGVLHTDRQGRESLVFDVMEPVRPHVDDYALGVLQRTVFQRRDFFERHDGNCRLMPTLAQPLAQTALRWRKLIAPIAENIADAFIRTDVLVAGRNPLKVQPTDRPIRTPLTGANHSRPSSPAQRAARPVASSAMASINRCADCGIDMGKRRRKYCDDCLPEQAARASARGVEVQRQLQRVGADHRSDKDVRERHRVAANKTAEARREWEATQQVIPSRAAFKREFGERVRAVTIDSLRGATGLSYAFCRGIRLGKNTPHPRHWDAIRQLVGRLPAATSLVDVARPKLSDWQKRIAPHLSALGAQGIQRATGLSASYARRILHGHHIPRPEHWPALLAAVDAS